MIPPNISDQIAKAGGKCWHSFEGEQLSPEGQVDSGWESITSSQVGWCTGPAPGLGLGEALSQQSQGVLVEGITPHISARHQGEILLGKVPWSLRQGLLSTTPGRNVNEKKNYGNRRNS